MRDIGVAGAIGQAVLASSVVVLLAASCRSTGKVQPTPSPTVATATPNITAAKATERRLTDSDAENLTLDAPQFGPAFAGFEPAQSTATLKVEDLEGDPCTADLAEAVKGFHFERGYNRDWVRPAGAQSTVDLSVGSYVEIYPDASAAHGKFAFDQAAVSKPLPAACNMPMETTTTFSVAPSIAEEAFGYRKTIPDDAGARRTYTWVEFRRGRVVAATDVIREDARETSTETTRFAETLDANIVQSLTRP
jgi:hypothetical protein